MERVNAWIAFGGNIGHVKETFIHARDALNETDGIHVIMSSKLYRTAPVGPAGQADYLNAVARIETTLDPHSLLEELHHIENHHGRERLPEQPRWGARTLDLDIIAMDDLTIESETLTIPHPMMQQRMFVLCPLCDMDPNWQHPVLKETARQLMSRLIAGGEAPLTGGEVW